MTDVAAFEVVACDAIDGLPPMQDGRAHLVEIIRCRSDLFRESVIITSDLHKDALQILEVVARQVNPREWHVISCGDMAGTPQWGEDATPFPVFEFIREHFASLHLVLGNHDTLSKAITGMRNADGQSCHLDTKPRKLAGRRICGVSGIIGKRNRPGRRAPEQFVEAVTEALSEHGRQSVLFTHETPRLNKFKPSIGQVALAETVERLVPTAHVFGHCHLEPIVVEDHGTLFINVDSRVLLVEPLRPLPVVDASKKAGLE